MKNVYFDDEYLSVWMKIFNPNENFLFSVKIFYDKELKYYQRINHRVIKIIFDQLKENIKLILSLSLNALIIHWIQANNQIEYLLILSKNETNWLRMSQMRIKINEFTTIQKKFIRMKKFFTKKMINLFFISKSN